MQSIETQKLFSGSIVPGVILVNDIEPSTVGHRVVLSGWDLVDEFTCLIIYSLEDTTSLPLLDGNLHLTQDGYQVIITLITK